MVATGDLEPIEITITKQEDGERLDRALSARTLGHSRSTLARWIDEGRVSVDGAVVAARSAKVRSGQRVVVRPAPPPPSDAEPQDIPLTVLFEDEHLLVIDKPAGLVVHPAPGHADGTLVNALLFHARVPTAARGEGAGIVTNEDGDPRRPGIVHRLDKDTSGVMVVAKTAATRDGLVALFQKHDIERRYVAIVAGEPPARATYDTLIGRHPSDRKRFTTKVARGKRAVTHMEVRERLEGAARVECRLETGRTHQIRVHLSEHGHPILGDPLYGRPPKGSVAREAAAQLGRQALHAAVLGFRHPATGEDLRFETEPPEDFRSALTRLRRNRALGGSFE